MELAAAERMAALRSLMQLSTAYALALLTRSKGLRRIPECHHQLMGTTDRAGARNELVRSSKSSIPTVAALVAVNLVVTCVILYFATTGGEDPVRPPKVWRAFVPSLGIQAVANGVLLLAFRRTREVGLGVLAGVLGVAVLTCAWLVVAVLPNAT